MQVCTLAKPDRDIWGTAPICVPEDAPMEVVNLIKACRNHDPRKRPDIGEICDLLEGMETEVMQAEMKINK